MILEKIQGSSDVKRVKKKYLKMLAKEMRDFLIDKLSKTGGHLASNLGVVELTIALYKSFDLPKDKVIWDVGHQSYPHKILSGRQKDFDELRMFGGMSGFPKTKESPCDAFNTGHSSTSISAGLGLARAALLKKENNYVVSIIGDGALTGGMAYEALNNAAALKRNFIIVLNDNEMSISKNVGGMSSYLNGIRTGDVYNKLKTFIYNNLEKVPNVGKSLIKSIRQAKSGIKQFIIPGMLFENMGITYLGPVDGHDIDKLCKVFAEAKKLNHAVIVHVITKKGKGYKPAEDNPEKFHGVSAFDKVTGIAKKQKTDEDYTDVFAKKIVEIGERDKDVVAITAAMPDGTGLKLFKEHFPERFHDVGIAEQHAVTMAAGMAAGGLKPVVAVYSSFLQRAFDQIIHDVCIQDLNVVFAIDRAGLVGADGETHQGIFDLSYLNCIPNMSIMAPKNSFELESMLDFAFKINGPVAIRYPRGKAYKELSEFNQIIEYGKAELLYEEKDIAIVACGSMVSTAKHVREKLKKRGYSVSIVNARFIKPIDTDMLDHICKNHSLIITMEENVLLGGFGLTVRNFISSKYKDIDIFHVNIPDKYVEHGDVSLLREALHIDSDSVIRDLDESELLKKFMKEVSDERKIRSLIS